MAKHKTQQTARKTRRRASPAKMAHMQDPHGFEFASVREYPLAEKTLEGHCADTLAKLHETLVSRGASYGSFFENSELSITLQELLQTTGADYRSAMHNRAENQANNAVPVSLIYLLLNATNMIAAKQSRLFATPIHADSWLDIAGYAILAHAAISMKGPKGA